MRDTKDKKIEVYVVSHSAEDIKKTRNDDLYTPLFVGLDGKDNLGYCSDDSGDNISNKNKSYCELTGLYWMWKNSDADIIGLCHYRRYFATSKHGRYLEREDIEEILKDYDMIVPPLDESLLEDVYTDYSLWNYGHDLDLCRDIISEQCPEYLDSFDKVMKGNSLYYYKIFISHKDVIDGYCEWIFPILQELENRVDLEDYDNYQQRIYGFLTERLFKVWVIQNNINVKEMDLRVLGTKLNIQMFIKKKAIVRKLYVKYYLPHKGYDVKR